MSFLGIFPPDHHRLLFRPAPPLSSTGSLLPPNITRTFINPTPSNPLELLTASPTSLSSSSKEKQQQHIILFIHGGFGSASVWVPFLTYFSQHPTHACKCYAVSLRGHGASWRPGYMEMVFRSGLIDFAADAKFAAEEIVRMEREENAGWDEKQLVLVAHSAGGGVAQYLMGEMDVKAGGLVLISSFPNFGGWRVYLNWALLDPLFLIRFLFRDLTHSRSPLSSTTLVHRAFFSPALPTPDVKTFESNLPEYESLLWPMQMMLRFVDPTHVLRSVLGWRNREQKWGGAQARERVLVVAGTQDRLMDVALMGRMRAEYCAALGDEDEEGEKGVGFAVVKGGHHLQNDLWWEGCAERIVEFVAQL